MPRRRKLKDSRPRIEDFKPDGVLSNALRESRYPPQVISSIIEASSSQLQRSWVTVRTPILGADPPVRSLPPRQALAANLEFATAIFIRDAEWEKKPTPSQMQRQLEAIRTTAIELLKALGLGAKHRSNPDLIPHAILAVLRQHAGFMNANGSARVRDAIKGIKDLHDWIERELWNMQVRERTPLKNRGDRAFNRLLESLAGIWRDSFGRAIDTSLVSGNAQSRGRVAGNFFPFVTACLAPLELPDRLREERSLATRLIRLKRRLSKSIEAI